jgi:hypothetical protein
MANNGGVDQHGSGNVDGCFGAASALGNEFVGRILTVSATCRQQRHLWTFLAEAVQAYWADRPAPSLVPIP